MIAMECTLREHIAVVIVSIIFVVFIRAQGVIAHDVVAVVIVIHRNITRVTLT